MRRERGGARRREVGVEQQSSLNLGATVRLAESLREVLDANGPFGLVEVLVLERDRERHGRFGEDGDRLRRVRGQPCFPQRSDDGVGEAAVSLRVVVMVDAEREARLFAGERGKQVFDRHLVLRYITMERRRVCPFEKVGTYDLCARARQQNCDAEGKVT